MHPLLGLKANKSIRFYMTTIKLAVLRHTRAKDGSYKIRISIGHKSETHYIVTKYRVASFANFKNGAVMGQPDASILNLKLRQLLNEYDERLERIPNTGELSCEELRNLLRDMPSANQNATFLQVAGIYIKKLTEEKRLSTAKLMQRHIDRFVEFTNGDIYMAHLTPRMIDDYVHHLRIAGYSNAYINISVTPIKTITNYAIKMQYVRYDISPFTYHHNLDVLPREMDLSVEDMRKVFAYQPTQYRTRRILDIFKLSFLLGGMNLADMLQYDFRKPDISYIRQKTQLKNQRPTQFNTPPEAKEIIQRYMNKDTGRLNIIGKGGYQSLISSINRSLKRTAKKLGLDCPRISFYSARKSFIQHGFDMGIPLEILEYCVGQTMKKNRPIFNYAKIMSKHADVAIRQIIDNIKPTILSDGGRITN